MARKRRGLTKVRLAALAGLTERSISAFESGSMCPSDQTARSLAETLGFPVEFFAGPPLEEPSLSAISFRALASTKAGVRDTAVAASTLAVSLSQWIEERFDLPKPSVPSARGAPPELAAEGLRAQWELGERPIRSMVHQLEARGVRVFSLSEQCGSVDAFSFWNGETPFIFLNLTKTAERSRYDAAHELGHLVMHRHGGPRGREAEHEANRFAASFLMPRGSVLALGKRAWTLPLLVKAKKRWNVSAGALAYRLKELGLMSEWNYRTLWIEDGLRTQEPDPSPWENSRIFQKVFDALKNDGVSRADVARQLAVYPSELDSLLFGLAVVALPGGARRDESEPRPRVELKLVD